MDLAEYRRRVAAEVRAAKARVEATDQDLALAAGVSRATIARSMGAERPFNLDEIYLIAKRLEVPPATLTRDGGAV